MSIYNTLLAQYKNYSDEPPVPPTPGPDYSEPFYVEDVSGSENTLSISKINSLAPTLTIEKSLDGKTWTSMGSTSTTAITATVPANGKLYLRCSANAWSNTNYYNLIYASSNFNVGGNTMSLLYGSNFTGEETEFPSVNNFIFAYLFTEATTLLSAEKLLLPATTLTSNCYESMFSGCTSLTTAPELPATTLASYCYNLLFSNCKSLTTAPELPATTLSKYCYRSLFRGCSSLNYIKVNFTVWPNMSSSSTSDYQATCYWTYFTKNTTGTFVCPAALPQEFNASGNNKTTTSSISGSTNAIPYGWTVETY